MLGDYYPLTPYSIQPADWIAWQFDRPDLAAAWSRPSATRPERVAHPGVEAPPGWPRHRPTKSPMPTAVSQNG